MIRRSPLASGVKSALTGRHQCIIAIVIRVALAMWSARPSLKLLTVGIPYIVIIV